MGERPAVATRSLVTPVRVSLLSLAHGGPGLIAHVLLQGAPPVPERPQWHAGGVGVQPGWPKDGASAVRSVCQRCQVAFA